MQLEGEQKIIKELEQTFRQKAMCFEVNKKSYDKLFGFESTLQTIVLDVFIPNQDYIFPAKFVYDNRTGGKSVVEIRDRDMWWPMKVAPEIIKLLAQLQPRRNEKQELLHGTHIKEHTNEIINKPKETKAEA